MNNKIVFTADWFSKSIPDIINFVTPVLNNKESLRILEIGSYEGLSTLWFLQNFLPNTKKEIYCVDTWQGAEIIYQSEEQLSETFDTNLDEFLKSGICTKLVGKSEITLKTLLANQETFDFIYIDGSHRSSDVMIDGVLSYFLLNQNGVMMFDDYLWSIGERPYNEIPHASIEFFRNFFVGNNRLQFLGAGQTAAFKKI